jgi:hypothetical protein
MLFENSIRVTGRESPTHHAACHLLHESVCHLRCPACIGDVECGGLPPPLSGEACFAVFSACELASPSQVPRTPLEPGLQTLDRDLQQIRRGSPLRCPLCCGSVDFRGVPLAAVRATGPSAAQRRMRAYFAQFLIDIWRLENDATR